MFHKPLDVPPGISRSRLLRDREHLVNVRHLARRLQVSGRYIDQLHLEAVLPGHEGCVNSLEWNRDGSRLASCSDDFHVIIWDVFRRRIVHRLLTKHLGNMFSVKFMPGHESMMATCAADKHVYVFDVNAHDQPLLQCNCHASRVKRLATAPDSPYVFWTAGEDGMVLQLDMRVQHDCRPESARVGLLNLCEYLGMAAEVKCVAVNPCRTEMLAVGANDPYARIYDRRMLKCSAVGEMIASAVVFSPTETPSQKMDKACATYYCPGHISKKVSRLLEHESRAITYLTFNKTGTELLVNMGGEHIYLFDLQSATIPKFLDLPTFVKTPADYAGGDADVMAAEVSQEAPNLDEASSSGAASSSVPLLPASPPELPDRIEAYKKRGNEYLQNEQYLHAIEEYSKAITMAPDCSVLYLNRATAYLKRKWFGDVYSALRDCYEALRLKPSYVKAHFRLARALLELGQAVEAEACLKELLVRFPTYHNNHGVQMLKKDIHGNSQTDNSPEVNCPDLNADEYYWRTQSKDYAERFVGHCNITTDIKEANFFGQADEFIVAGSDDQCMYFWERRSGNIRAVYNADEAIVNCVQPHPSICMLATSGIDHTVKIWSPKDSDEKKSELFVSQYYTGVEENQLKMKSDPFELSTRNAYCWNG